MKVTRQQMQQILPNGGVRTSEFLHYINQWADAFGISSPLRMSHFLGQILHETNGLKYTRELGKTEYFKKYEEGKLAKTLGNTHKGDGEKYKGRGLIMITGRANYKEYNDSPYCNGDVMKQPELLERPCGATKSGMWWWWKHGCNAIADEDDIEALTKKINGGTNGLDSRTEWTNLCKKVFGV